MAWIKLLNAERKTKKLAALTTEAFEHVMDGFEKEAYSILSTNKDTCNKYETTSNPLSTTSNQQTSTSKLSSNASKPLSYPKPPKPKPKPLPPMPEVCCICRESQTGLVNNLLKCDNCALLVHQDCYGVPYQNEGAFDPSFVIYKSLI